MTETVIAIAAALTALGVIYRTVVRPTWRRTHAMWDLIERELQPNGGGSLKDQAAFVAAQVNPLGDRLSALEVAVRDMASTFNDEKAEVWKAIAALSRNPERETR